MILWIVLQNNTFKQSKKIITRKNFKKHEDVIAGVEDEDLDMEQIFKDAEAALEDEET